MTLLGEAIHTARIATGITQAELSQRTGVTQAALSRYENNLREPDPATLTRLASATGVSTQLLTNMSRKTGAIATHAHMRRRATGPARAWIQLEARLNVLREQMHLLLSSIDYETPHSLSRLDPLDYLPHEAARLTREQLRMPQGPVRNLAAWMESAGCLIIEQDFGTPRVDGLSQWTDRYPVVLINARMPTDRKRFTLAHELGHLVMHSVPAHLTEGAESEAMAFAAELLMPAHLIRPELRNRSLGHLVNLKRKWMVSIAALIERAHDLGTVSQTARTSLYKALSARGWRKREPISHQLPADEPSTPTAIVQTFQQLAYQPDQIAAFGGFADVDAAAAVLPLHQGLRVVRQEAVSRTLLT